MDIQASAQHVEPKPEEEPFTKFWSFHPNPKMPDENDPANWMTGDDYCEFALEHYNETEGVDFELVKVVANMSTFAGCWILLALCGVVTFVKNFFTQRMLCSPMNQPTYAIGSQEGAAEALC